VRSKADEMATLI